MESGLIDLHVHSSCSDGDYSPRDLIKLASSRGITVLAITDHDTVAAYDDDIVGFALKLGVTLIPGIEFSTIDEQSRQKVHVVGLNIDVNNHILRKTCDDIRDRRREIAKKTARALEKAGIKIQLDALLSQHAVVTKSHIGNDAVSNPDNARVLRSIYGQLPIQGTFIEDFLIKGRPAFVENNKVLTTREAVNIIKQASGVAFCAHPSFNVMRGFSVKDMKLLILRNSFDGVEAINIQYDKSNHDKRFDMVDEFVEFANNTGLLISGGSDYHSNDNKLWGRRSSLGLEDEKYRVEQDIVDIIINHTPQKSD